MICQQRVRRRRAVACKVGLIGDLVLPHELYCILGKKFVAVRGMSAVVDKRSENLYVFLGLCEKPCTARMEESVLFLFGFHMECATIDVFPLMEDAQDVSLMHVGEIGAHFSVWEHGYVLNS